MSESTPSVSEITEKTLEVFGVEPCKFQAQICDLQLRGVHSVLVSPTGSGKSLTFLMPFLWQPTGICIVISPLQLLGSQHASHAALKKLGINAINLTSETATNQSFTDIASGKYQLVIASPEYVDEDPRFRKYLWDVPSFRNRVTRIIFDEAHCVLDWGDFRPAYRRLHYLVHLLRGATFLALSATLSPDMVKELQHALNLYDMVVFRRSCDRPNVTLIARAMKHSFASLHDIAFLIPLNRIPGSPPPPKFMLFMRTKKHCERAAKFLRGRLPAEERDRVVWVHAEMTRGFNENAMERLRNGELFGIVCTDVAGMGIDIPDIEYVVQDQLPESYPTVGQRNGRTARGKGKKGKAVVFFESRFRRKEKKVEQNKKRALEDHDTSTQSTKRRCVTDGAPETPQATEAVDTQAVTPIAKNGKSKTKKRKRKCADDLDKVIDSFINGDLHPDGPKCRREAGNQFFANPGVPQEGDPDYCCSRCCPPPPPRAECCDVCNPALAEFLYENMDKPKRAHRQPAPTPLDKEDSNNWTDVDRGLEEALYIWREATAEAKWGPYHPVGGLGIINDEHIEQIVQLARRQLIPTIQDLERELRWLYMPEHGAEILAIVHSLTRHPPPTPRQLLSPLCVKPSLGHHPGAALAASPAILSS